MWRMVKTPTRRTLATRHNLSTSEQYIKNMLEITQVSRSLQASRSDFTYLPTVINIPHQEPWPKHLRGQSFNGNYLRQQYRTGTIPQEYVAQFDALRFVWSRREHKWTIRLLAFETYKKLHGDLRICHGFEVPNCDPTWPKDTWNLQLGFAVNNIRSGRIRCSDEIRTKLNTMGFIWDMNQSIWDNNLFALNLFEQTFGHVNVPQTWVVPESWNNNLQGIMLGIWVNNIRYNKKNLTSEKITQLNQLGFAWKSPKEIELNQIHIQTKN
ncbi:Carboxyvinyl-carboxyphosphonate phosphorylmutase [Thraustotheca clavata]|uniref:Carboxyvinyl-carboxyphosphonate phosphorylmutase n=1 Tax=Thraustotheca clavata TaxID=74557 RepID=A0A1W0ABM2_9STRA|nr:Carboxyvinyl-carboxyphosphonate phosphorylmutase [Thraustotheca clavata]